MGARQCKRELSLSTRRNNGALVVDETHTHPHLHKALTEEVITRSGWPESCSPRRAPGPKAEPESVEALGNRKAHHESPNSRAITVIVICPGSSMLIALKYFHSFPFEGDSINGTEGIATALS